MLQMLRDIFNYLEESDRNEKNTPVRLRPVLKSIDSNNLIPYAQSFAMHICNSLFKGNSTFCERLCNDFVQTELCLLNNLVQEDGISYPDLMSTTKKLLHQYISMRLSQQELPGMMTENVKTTRKVFFKAITNKRNKQEDRFFVVSDIFKYSGSHNCYNGDNCSVRHKVVEPVGFVGLFDGHNGPEAAEHCHHLAPYIVSSYLQSSLCNRGYFNLVEALGETFYSLNLKLNGCRNRYRWKAGTTSTLCLIDNEAIYTSWVGDSSAWLIYNDSSQVALTNILHRPSQKSEVVDVWNNGGIVTKTGKDFDRVNGILAVTRALGDDRKIAGVSALPSMSECTLTGNELCLLLASDGLWDSKDCTGQDIGNLCREFLRDGGSGDDPHLKIELLFQAIIDRAVKGGASDNITLVLMMFNGNRNSCNNSQLDDSYFVNSHFQDSRAVQWPKDRRMSCFVQDISDIRWCPPGLGSYLESHFNHDFKMHHAIKTSNDLLTSRQRIRRTKSLSQEIHKRFSSPIRCINSNSRIP